MEEGTAGVPSQSSQEKSPELRVSFQAQVSRREGSHRDFRGSQHRRTGGPGQARVRERFTAQGVLGAEARAAGQCVVQSDPSAGTASPGKSEGGARRAVTVTAGL